MVNQRQMIDTNTVSYIVRGKSQAARDRLEGLQVHEIACISVMTEAKLRFGLAKLPNADKLKSAVEAFLTKVEILAWGSNEAHVYGALRAKQEASGKKLSSMDLLIAAHAISVDAILVSNDAAFSQVSGLRAVVSWATDL